jgi:hypothetical protein
MCLIVKEKDYKIKKSDGFFVYKLIDVNGKSMYKFFLYEFLKIEKTKLDFPNPSIHYKCLEIERGFHSYLKHNNTLSYKLNPSVLMKVLCYIPKNAEYVLGWDNVIRAEYDTIVSNEIVILGEVNERKTKILQFLIKIGLFNLLKFIGCIKK